MGSVHHFRPGRAVENRYRRQVAARRSVNTQLQHACAEMLEAIRQYAEARNARIRAGLETGRRS